jgi:hypothetical protein
MGILTPLPCMVSKYPSIKKAIKPSLGIRIFNSCGIEEYISFLNVILKQKSKFNPYILLQV